MTDFYIQNPEALNGQPKKTIGDYVEQNGILVPRRHASLDEALSSGRKIIARTEHEQDYAGASGILGSPVLDKDTKLRSEKSLRRSMFAQNQEYKDYCELMGVSPRKFRDEISFSYWDFLEGHNLTVVGDSSKKNRYHIFSNDIPYSYIQIEGEAIQTVRGVPKGVLESISQIVELYDAVTGLEKFDVNHRPIIEMQFHEDKIYFLQYHLGRNFKEADFSLDRKPNSNELQAVFVRGSTNKEGMTAEVTLCQGRAYYGEGWKLADEEGSADLHFNTIFSELMMRQRKLQVMIHDNLDRLVLKALSGHINTTMLFKPEVSIVVSNDQFEELVPDDEHRELIKKAKESQEDQSVKLSVVSDGTTAYVGRA